MSPFITLNQSTHKLPVSKKNSDAKIEPANIKKKKEKKLPKVEKPKLTGLPYYLNKIENLYEKMMQIK